MAQKLIKRNGRTLSIPQFDFLSQLRGIENLMTRMFDENEDTWLSSAVLPSVDLSETDDEVDVAIDLPGMKPEEIDVHVHNNLLTVTGERKEESEEKGRTFHRVERRSGSFSRTVSLPCHVDEAKVDAKYRDGVLSITMPKTKEAQAKKIPVKA